HTFAIHPASVGCETCDAALGRRGLCDAHYNPALVQARCIRMLIGEVVRAAFSGQMGRHDGKVYAAWLEALDEIDDTITQFRLPLEQVRWLSRLVARDDIKVAPGLAQWREVVAEHLEALVADAERDAGQAS
ncbi:MAG: hypothetical protein Q7J56_03930, partial [Deltaproteobacteria bacterium]|nr:hypothetical protein [Deltaproteobacteria bacterium]